MMLGSLHLASFDFGPGTLAAILFGAGAAVAMAAVLIVAAVRRTGLAQAITALWGGALVFAGAAFATVLVHQHLAGGGASSEDGRRAIERQAAELTQRALEPGSTLACLDAVSGPVADACEHALFAKPEGVAAAVDYVDAKLSLLTASLALADREAELRPLMERLRGTLEADRFGFVAHVLTTRGCKGPDCADLKLLRDPTRVLANMTAHTFETRIGLHAAAWQENGAATASLTPPGSVTSTAQSAAPMASIGAIAPLAPPTTSGVATGGRVEFPSAASIPPVSIMTPEPPPSAQPPAAEAKPTPPPKRAATPRRQAPREQAASIPSPPHRPAVPPQRPAASSAPPPAQPAPAAVAPEQVVTPDPLPSHGVN